VYRAGVLLLARRDVGRDEHAAAAGEVLAGERHDAFEGQVHRSAILSPFRKPYRGAGGTAGVGP